MKKAKAADLLESAEAFRVRREKERDAVLAAMGELEKNPCSDELWWRLASDGEQLQLLLREALGLGSPDATVDSEVYVDRLTFRHLEELAMDMTGDMDELDNDDDGCDVADAMDVLIDVGIRWKGDKTLMAAVGKIQAKKRAAAFSVPLRRGLWSHAMDELDPERNLDLSVYVSALAAEAAFRKEALAIFIARSRKVVTA